MSADQHFLVKENPELGRYGVAAKDLKAGDIVFQEIPFAVGPKTDSVIVCLSCNCTIENCQDVSSKCSLCGWPLCADCNALQSGLHSSNECKVFQDNKVLFHGVTDDEDGICHQLDCVTPLR